MQLPCHQLAIAANFGLIYFGQMAKYRLAPRGSMSFHLRIARATVVAGNYTRSSCLLCAAALLRCALRIRDKGGCGRHAEIHDRTVSKCGTRRLLNSIKCPLVSPLKVSFSRARIYHKGTLQCPKLHSLLGKCKNHQSGVMPPRSIMKAEVIFLEKDYFLMLLLIF